jgi:hypothetical protein
MSAACLLERYLEDKGVGSVSAPVCSYPPPEDLESFSYEIVKSYIRRKNFRPTQADLKLLRQLPTSDASLISHVKVAPMPFDHSLEYEEKFYEQNLASVSIRPVGVSSSKESGEKEDSDVARKKKKKKTIRKNKKLAERAAWEARSDKVAAEVLQDFRKNGIPSNRRVPFGTLKNPFWWEKDLL